MKKGFTLIELLAVLVITAILILITAPVVLGTIKSSKKSSTQINGKNYINSINIAIKATLSANEFIKDGVYSVMTNGDLCMGVINNTECNGSKIKVGANVTDEFTGSVIISNNKVKLAKIYNSNFTINYNSNYKLDVVEGREEIKLSNAIKADNTILDTPITTPGKQFSLESEANLVKNLDDDGITYYFRGNVKNNYVQLGIFPYDIYYNDGIETRYCENNNNNCAYSNTKFAKGSPMIFRIVRINGDGTIRLILEPSLEELSFTYAPGYEKGIAYSYDSGASSSHLKERLDEWYEGVKTANPGIDNIVVNGKFCNDTSVGKIVDNIIYYGAYIRNFPMDGSSADINPSFKCPSTTKDFGGLLNLKVGAVTADEVSFAGSRYNEDYLYKNQKFYMYNGFYNFTLSPAYYGTPSGPGEVIEGDAYLRIYFYGNVYNAARPTINIKADSLIIGGNGTKDNPYVVKIN